MTRPKEMSRNCACGEALLRQRYSRYLQNRRKHEVLSEAPFPCCESERDCSHSSSSAIYLQWGPSSAGCPRERLFLGCSSPQ